MSKILFDIKLNGKCIEEHRERRNETRTALAEKLGVGRELIERIEDGREFADPALMDAIEEELGIKLRREL